jgi:Predicted membrane protein
MINKDNKKEDKNKTPLNLSELKNWPLRITQGALVGGGAILPGVSGGVLCVAFGIYRPMMELLSHPIKSFKIYYKLFIPFLIGWVAGFWGLARLTVLLFTASSTAAVSLFAGLVAGSLPMLILDASREGTSRRSYIGFTISAFLMFTLLSVLKSGASAAITPNIGWYIFCGIIWGMSLVIPGLSSSSILIFLGLYEPMAAGIAALNAAVILPLVAGIAVTAALSARLVDGLFHKHYSVTYFTVLGVVLSSTLLILPTGFSSVADAVLCALLFTIGFAGAYLMNREK